MTHHVYFARVGAYVKIGHSGNVMGRMKSIKSDHCIKPDDLDRHAPVELLRAIPDCTPNDEFQAHFLFWDHHAKGEWFHYSEQIAGEIVLVGIGHTRESVLPRTLVEKSLTVHGSHGFTDELPEAVRLIAEAPDRYRWVITDAFSLAEAEHGRRRWLGSGQERGEHPTEPSVPGGEQDAPAERVHRGATGE